MKYKENCVLNFNIIKYEIKRKILKIFRIQYKKKKVHLRLWSFFLEQLLYIYC